jgi:hypothetical protein
MPFRDEITSGEALNRTGIKSPNYVAGSAGWRVGKDGSAEFNSLTSRGTFTTGVAPAPRVVISTKAGVGAAPSYGQIEMLSGAAGEVAGGKAFTQADQFGRTVTYLMSNDMGQGTVGLRLEAPTSAAGHGLVTLKDLLTNGQRIDFDVENGQIAADAQPYGYALDGTSRSTASLTYVGIAGQGTQITMAAPLSNRLLLLVWALSNNATANSGCLFSAEVRDGSLGGAVLFAAPDIGAVRNNNTGNVGGMGFMYADLSGNPPTGANVYIRGLFRVTAGTGNYPQSAIAAIALP